MDILEQAEQVTRDLTAFKKHRKAIDEAEGLRSGRGTNLLLQALEVDDRQLDRAIERLSKSCDSVYTRLAYNLNSQARED